MSTLWSRVKASLASFTETASASITTPDAGVQHVFIDSSDHHVKRKNAALAVTDLERIFVGDTGSPSNPASGLVPAPSVGDAAALKYLKANGSWATVTGAVAGAGGLVGVQVITATGAGTYTPTSGTNAIVIELQGAGGGGGGIASPTGTNVAFGRSAGGGGFIRHRLTTAFSGASYSVGAKGTGGTAGANDGTDGGSTTFTATGGGGTVYTAAGGGKGVGGTGAGAGGISIVAGAGGTCTNGTIRIPGEDGHYGFSIANPNVVSGSGGNSHYGSGGKGQNSSGANTSNPGNNATGYGAGGSGAAGAGTGGAQAGGNGSDGIIIIWEYS